MYTCLLISVPIVVYVSILALNTRVFLVVYVCTPPPPPIPQHFKLTEKTISWAGSTVAGWGGGKEVDLG